MISTMEKDLVKANGEFKLVPKELPDWYGIPNIGFIYNGSWNDPHLEYKGKRYNSVPIEETMWSYFNEWCEETCEKPTEELFVDYMQANADDVYELLENA